MSDGFDDAGGGLFDALIEPAERAGRWHVLLRAERLDAALAPLWAWLDDAGSPPLTLHAGGRDYDHAELTGVARDAARMLHDTIRRGGRRRRLGARDLAMAAAAAQNLAVVASLAAERGAPADEAVDLAGRLAVEASVALDQRFEPHGDGSFATRWTPVDRMVIEGLASEVEGLLDGDSPDVARLFPPAYPDDADRQAGYAALAREELIAARRESFETLRDAIERDVATEDEMLQMMRAVNDLRLVLGTRLDVSEDDRHGPDPDDPDAATWAVYQHLTHLLGQIIEALRTG